MQPHDPLDFNVYSVLSEHLATIRVAVSENAHIDAATKDVLTSAESLVLSARQQAENALRVSSENISRLKGLVSEARERAGNAEALRTEVSLKNKALELELRTARADLSRLRARLRDVEAAAGRPRVPTAELPGTAPMQATQSPPPAPRTGSASGAAEPADGLRDSEYRSRARTQESATSGSSFTNLAALFSGKGASTTAHAGVGQAKSPAGVAMQRYRNRAGSAPQPLSPSRQAHASARPLAGAGSAASMLVDAVHYSGRASPAPALDADGPASFSGSRRSSIGLSLDGSAGTGMGLEDMLRLTMAEWQERTGAGTQGRGAGAGVSAIGPTRPMALSAGPSIGGGLFGWVNLAADQPKPVGSPAQPAATAAAPSPTAAPAPISVLRPISSTPAAPTSSSEEVLRPEIDVTTEQGAAGGATGAGPAAAAAPADAPAPASPPALVRQQSSLSGGTGTSTSPAPWSSVASMWSSWIQGSMQARAGAGTPGQRKPDPGQVTSPAPQDAPPSDVTQSPPSQAAASAQGTTGQPTDDASPERDVTAFKSRSRSLPGVLLRAALGDEFGGDEAVSPHHGVVEVDGPEHAVGLVPSPRHAMDRDSASVGTLLASVPLFASLSGTERHIIAASLEHLHAAHGEVICTGDADGAAPLGEPALFLILQGAVVVTATGSRRLDTQDAPSQLYSKGEHFSTGDIRPACVAVARTACKLMLLRRGTLTGLLQWFSEARGINTPQPAVATIFGRASLGKSSSKDSLAVVRTAIQSAVDIGAYAASLRRVAPLVHSLALPHRKTTLTRRPGTVGPSVKREVEQAHKDFTRESGVVVNDEYIPLGTTDRFNHFLGHLATVARQHCTEALTSADDTASSPSTVENVVACLVCELLVASSRTVTGGDSYVQANVLLGRPDLAFIAAESGGQAPTEITIGPGLRAHIVGVNTFKVCAMVPDEDEGPGDGQGQGTSQGQGQGQEVKKLARSRSSTNHSLPGHASTWALLRCRYEERLDFAVGPPQAGMAGDATPAAAVALANAYQAVAGLFTVSKQSSTGGSLSSKASAGTSSKPTAATASTPGGRQADVSGSSDESQGPAGVPTVAGQGASQDGTVTDANGSPSGSSKPVSEGVAAVPVPEPVTVTDIKSAIAGATGGEASSPPVHVAKSTRTLGVSIHVFDTPE